MKRYPSPKLAAQMHLSLLKNNVKNKQKNVKTRKNANILETARFIAKSSKFKSKELLSGAPKGMIFGFKLYKKMFKTER